MLEKNFELAAKVLFFGTLEESYSIKKAAKISHLERADILKEIHEILIKKKEKSYLNVSLVSGFFKIKEKVDTSAWRQFKLNCDELSFYPVLYRWIGGFSDSEIENVLSVGKGTLFTRYNRGLLKLGEYLVQGRVRK